RIWVYEKVVSARSSATGSCGCKNAAAMFGLAYHRPDDWPSLDEALAGAWRRAGATVIELAVNETDGTQTLQQLLAQVSRL
ncbi:hypothetical protein PXW85_20775, partial [Klebsiella pneumoniae]|nr:hypothetical protein [Klebsiella pneumoniae]